MMVTMFERYTPSARQVIVFAQEEARGLRHNAIGSEHILIGLLRDELGNGGRALRGLGLDVGAVHERVGAMLPAGAATTAGQIPFTPRAQRILGRADAESLSLGHEGVGTEHLLLALARESDGIAMRVLGEQGIGADALRDAVRRTLDEPVPDAVLDRPAAAPRSGPRAGRRAAGRARRADGRRSARCIELRMSLGRSSGPVGRLSHVPLQDPIPSAWPSPRPMKMGSRVLFRPYNRPGPRRNRFL
jgi:ATP-dependent Clp protease ATP-binding subunit ClpC